MSTKAISKAGVPATCLTHSNSKVGEPTVFVNGVAVITLGDVAGGSISGPGNPKVKVQGKIISLVQDSISPHGEPPHSSAKTGTYPSPNVFA